MRIAKSDNLSFKARRVAIANLKLPEKALRYDIYNISSKDVKYLEGLKANLDLKSLWTKLNYSGDYDWWDLAIKEALSVDNERNFNFLLLEDNKPCGAIKGVKLGDSYSLSYASTWPVEKNKKAPFVMKSLLLFLYKVALDTKRANISLCAIKNSPFKVIEKLQTLNFKPCNDYSICTDMEVGEDEIKGAIQKYKNIIDISYVKEDEVDLSRLY